MTTDAGCKQVLTTVTWFEASALISNSSLFLFRVLAVFADSVIAKTAFICLWLTTFLSLTIPFSMTINFAPLACNIRKVQLVGSAGFFAVAVFDTLVFMAISFRLYAIKWCALRKRRLTPISFLCGKGLGRASNALLRTGQVYYMFVVFISLLHFYNSHLSCLAQQLDRMSLCLLPFYHHTNRFLRPSEPDSHLSALQCKT